MLRIALFLFTLLSAQNANENMRRPRLACLFRLFLDDWFVDVNNWSLTNCVIFDSFLQMFLHLFFLDIEIHNHRFDFFGNITW